VVTGTPPRDGAADTTDAFDLVSSPWLPILDEAGRQRMVGLRDVLTDAHRIQEIIERSPLALVALYRLLLSIVRRTHGPLDGGTWAALWRAGRLDASLLDVYWARWTPRLALFDHDYPFMQDPSLGAASSVSVAKFSPDRAAGNNAVLLDHSLDATPRGLTPAAAARLMIGHQAFALQGFVSVEPGQDPRLYKSAPDSPLIGGLVVLIQGGNLARTLLLNLCPVPGRAPPGAGAPRDRPTWEREASARETERYPEGPCDLLTWQSRRILLQRDADGLVRRAWIQRKAAIPRDWDRAAAEPMMPHAAGAAGLDTRLLRPLRPQPGRALWRDLPTLLSAHADGRLSTPTLSGVAAEIDAGVLPSGYLFALRIIALANRQAAPLYWIDEQVTAPGRMFAEPARAEHLALAMGMAELVAGAAARAARSLAVGLLTSGERVPPAADVERIVRRLRVVPRYWERLTPRVAALQDALASPVVAGDGGLGALLEWQRACQVAGSVALSEAAAHLGDGGVAARAAAQAALRWRRELAQSFDRLAAMTGGEGRARDATEALSEGGAR